MYATVWYLGNCSQVHIVEPKVCVGGGCEHARAHVGLWWFVGV